MTNRAKWLDELAGACWRKLHPDSTEDPRIPAVEQLLADIDAEYMAVARGEYRSYFHQSTILAYPQLSGVEDDSDEKYRNARTTLSGGAGRDSHSCRLGSYS